MNKRLGLLQIHIAALLAGFTGLFGKFLPVSPSVITGGRTLAACCVLALAAAPLRARLGLKCRRDALLLVASGALLAAHWMTFFQAIQVSTVAIGLLAFCSYPLFVTLIEPLLFGERWQASDVITSLAVVAGLVLVVPSFDLGNHLTQGLLWGILSGFLCALVSFLNRTLVRCEYPAVTVAFYQQGTAALLLLPALVRSGTVFSTRTVLLLLLLGIVFTALLQILYVSSLQHIRAQTASVVFGLEPVYGIAFAALLLGEVPSLRTILGGVLVCGAVFSATWKHATPTPV
jgi:drug/metabolite transporter (DMT)-like permease